MTTELPDPLTPADCDLRDFLFMPLDVLRLRDSDIAVISSGDEFRCAVLLWCASWHQVPAASLPDDDIILSGLSGFGRVVKEWKRVREGALRGWIKCADGRLYHPVVSEKANEAWRGRLEYREKKEAERIRKAELRAAKKAAGDAVNGSGNPLDIHDLSDGQNTNVQQTDTNSPPDNHHLSAGNHSERDSGQWTVDSGQLTSKPTSSSHTPNSEGDAGAGDRDDSLKAISRNVEISILLRNAGVSPMTAMHPLAIEWAANPKLTDALLLEAVEDARRYKPEGGIATNYLAAIIPDKLTPKRPNTDNAWRKTPQGIEQMGNKLGMLAKRNEDHAQYADRIAIEIRNRKAIPPLGGNAS
jgi:hypothetical protein